MLLSEMYSRSGPRTAGIALNQRQETSCRACRTADGLLVTAGAVHASAAAAGSEAGPLPPVARQAAARLLSSVEACRERNIANA